MMSVSLSDLPVHFQTAGERIYLHVAKWMGYAVSFIVRAVDQLPENVKEGLAVAGCNVVFFEISLMICKIVHLLLNALEPYDRMTDRGKIIRNFGLGCIFFYGVVKANQVTSKVLDLTLPLWKLVAIGTVTNVVWMIYRSRP